MSTSRPAFLYRPSSLATITGMWTILGGDVGMPITTFCCAPAAVGTLSAAAASRATVELNMCMSSSETIFLRPSDARDGGARTAGLPAETGILPDHTAKNNEGGLAISGSGPDTPKGRL